MENKQLEEQQKNMEELHKVFRDFKRHFWNEDEAKFPFVKKDKLAEWVADNVEDAHIVYCDDRYHCGSSLVFIEHKNDKEYWGTTVVFFPQCCDRPISFFLYPQSLRDMLGVLTEIDKK